jgi:hypothetical protein
MSAGDLTDARLLAREYIDSGCDVVPLDPGSKGNHIRDWQNKTFTERDFSERSNIGVKTGKPSHDLIDVDLDCALAVDLAPQILPATPAKFGRGGVATHWLFIVEDAETVKHKLPAGIQGDGHATTVEIRAGGCQTMFPGSIHPNGQPVEWIERGEPAKVTRGELERAVHQLHNAVVSRLRLRELCRPAAEARDGERNDTANKTAFIVGQRVAAGEYKRSDAEIELYRAAAACGLSDQEAKDVIPRALDEGAKARPTAAPVKSYDRCVILPGGDVSISACAEEVFAKMAKSREIFTRGGVPCELVKDRNMGSLVRPITGQGFRSRLEKQGAVMVWRASDNGPMLKPTTCSKDIAEALLASEAARDHLPMLMGLVNAPVCWRGEAGPVVLRKGYHAESGLLVMGGEVEDVLLPDAKRILAELFQGFDFVSDGDRARAYAMLLTPALCAGGWITRERPAFTVEADHSQSGKGYLTKIIFGAYRETPYEVSMRKDGVGSFDESFSAALLAGRMFIRFDNLRGRLDSQMVEAAMTAAGPVMARVPRMPEMPVDPKHFTLFLTSNGLETTPDFANRSCIVRIRKRWNATFKAYTEGDILDHVQAHQGAVLGAVFAVIRAWAEAGCPRTSETRHDFRQWAGVLDWIVTNVIGTPGRLLDGHLEAKQRVSNPALSWLRNVAVAVEGENRMDTAFFAGELADLCGEHDIDLPGLRPDAAEADRNRRVGILLKKCLGDEKDTATVDGYTVTRTEGERYYPVEQQTKTVKTYTFSVARGENGPKKELPEEPELGKSELENTPVSTFTVPLIPVIPVTPPTPPNGKISFRRYTPVKVGAV